MVKSTPKNPLQYEKEYLDRLDFDQSMDHNAWIVSQFEKVLNLD